VGSKFSSSLFTPSTFENIIASEMSNVPITTNHCLDVQYLCIL
jgi:predicted permease